MTPEETRALLEQLARHWAAKDLTGVLACFAADGEYHASVGPEPGASARGIDPIRSLLERMFAHDEGSRAEISDLAIFENRAVWVWRYHFDDGRVEHGCDLFEFHGDHIAKKDAFRKTFG